VFAGATAPNGLRYEPRGGSMSPIIAELFNKIKCTRVNKKNQEIFLQKHPLFTAGVFRDPRPRVVSIHTPDEAGG